MALTKPAALSEVQEANNDPALQIIRAELSELRNEIRHTMMQRVVPEEDLSIRELEAILSSLVTLERRLMVMETNGKADLKLYKDLQNSREVALDFSPRVPRTKAAVVRVEEIMRILADLDRRYAALYQNLFVANNRQDA